MDHVNKRRKLTRKRVQRFRAVQKILQSGKSIVDPVLEVKIKVHSVETEQQQEGGSEVAVQGGKSGNRENAAKNSDENVEESEENMDQEDSDGEDNMNVEECHSENMSEEESDREENVEEKSNDDENVVDEESDSEGNMDEEESNDDENMHEEEFDEVAALRQWAITSNIQHTHLDSLLGILSTRLLPQLPKSSKTFLKTNSATYIIEQFRGVNGSVIGEFVYFGISEYLQMSVNTDLHEEDVLYLQINIDGLPLFKSSSQQFWPILCKIHFDPDVYKPIPVAVYSGTQKPDNLDEYFSKFVDELNSLYHEGIEINGRIFKVHIKCFVCDRPARSFIKCIKGHGGYYACERCVVRGERYNNRTVYNSRTCDKRTDASFRNQDQTEHHTGITPLTLIPQLDMIDQFALDFMHLCCLGIMKKLLLDSWIAGNRNVKLSQNSKLQLSEILVSLHSQVPQDFQRTTRSLFDISKWKATEFRFFLLYCGPVVLKRILPTKLFKHFLLLHPACRILCSEDLAPKFCSQAKAYLKSFVLLSERYSRTQSQIINMHNLIHLADDLKNMNCSLSKFTAFPFENVLGKMKKLLRSGNRPLSQLCRRLHESFFANHDKITIPPTIQILKSKRVEPLQNTCIRKLRFKGAVLSNQSPDNTVLLENRMILQIATIYIPPNEDEHRIQISGRILNINEPIFTYPCNSETLNMWKVTETQIKRTFPLRCVRCKMVNLKVDCSSGRKKIYVMPLLHQ